MKHLGMTNGQLRALLEAIRIINDLTNSKHDLDEQLVRIQNSIDKGAAQPAKTEKPHLTPKGTGGRPAAAPSPP